MCVGYTHSGKTTFARQLVEKYPKTVLIDTDEIALFLKEKYPLLMDSTHNKGRSDFTKSGIKGTVFKNIYQFCLETGLSIILSNGNLSTVLRTFIIEHAKEKGYEVTVVYFNLPKETIIKRIENSSKSTQVFTLSKSWSEVFDRQQKESELPPSREGVTFFEIKNDNDFEVVYKEIENL